MVTNMIEENVDTDATFFLDTSINAFRAEPISLEKVILLALISQEVTKYSKFEEFWTMYFDGANLKEGEVVGFVFISLNMKYFRYYFYACKN